jgi:hypothetical protein
MFSIEFQYLVMGARFALLRFLFFSLFLKVEKPMSLALLALACFVIITVLISLQFPAIMSSPWAALSFAACFTAVLGSVATFVGDEIAPLPLYALIMVK